MGFERSGDARVKPDFLTMLEVRCLYNLAVLAGLLSWFSVRIERRVTRISLASHSAVMVVISSIRRPNLSGGGMAEHAGGQGEWIVGRTAAFGEGTPQNEADQAIG